VDEAAAVVQKIHGINFPALDPGDWKDMAHALYCVKNGVFRADFDPAIAEQMRQADLSKEGPTLWPQFALFGSAPVMAIRGQTSQLLTDKTLSEMQSALQNLQILQVPGQGHAPILHHRDVYPTLQQFLRLCP
jgi:pimeloyl-ACP methyl ester carboxylesterase